MRLAGLVRDAREYGLSHTVRSQLQAKLKRPLPEFTEIAALVQGKKGLELGGPSQSFETGGILPVYDCVDALDNCTYAEDTLWARHGKEFRFSDRRPPGSYFVGEGTDLGGIADGSYELILSSHMIEHTANPLRALAAWRRVLKPQGTLLMLVPDKANTFDNLRATTTLAHLMEDLDADMGEDDLSHVEEMLQHHNMRRTPEWTPDGLRDMVENNLRTRGLHHHVFDEPLVRQMVEHAGFEVVLTRTALPNHIVCVAKKR